MEIEEYVEVFSIMTLVNGGNIGKRKEQWAASRNQDNQYNDYHNTEQGGR